MKKAYEYRSIFDLNKALSQFDKEGLEVCVKIEDIGDKAVFFCITDNGEKSEPEEEPEEGEGEEKEDEEGEGEDEKKD